MCFLDKGRPCDGTCMAYRRDYCVIVDGLRALAHMDRLLEASDRDAANPFGGGR